MVANILVVDDSPTSSEGFKAILEKEHHNVFISYDGIDLIEIIAKNEIDIVLLDVVMPKINGFDILRSLQNTEQTMEIPVIMITSLTSAENVKLALDCGALDYIRKPCEPIELIARVSSALRLKAKQNQLKEMLKRDALTSLYNRRYFNTTIEQIFQNKDAFNYGISLVMADCDHFKSINDTYGHTSGDDVLISISKLLATSVRSADIVCRYGGEEFCIILPNTSIFQACVITERFRKKVEKSIMTTISCGISHTAAGDNKTALCLINEADAALYSSKKNGRNRIETYKDA